MYVAREILKFALFFNKPYIHIYCIYLRRKTNKVINIITVIDLFATKDSPLLYRFLFP